MTIYTIVFNGYGKYLDKWLENVRKNKPDKIIVVLGKNHGVTELYDDVTYIHSESNIMGTLRNLAIDKVDTEWMLYFSVDDTLYDNAVEQIKKCDADVVGLKFMDGNEIKESALFSVMGMKNWRSSVVPGYIAIRNQIKYDEIEIPNYTYLFKIAVKRLKKCHTEGVVARYDRRPNSHGDTNLKNGRYKEFAKFIDKEADKYFKKYANKHEKDNWDTYIALKNVKDDNGIEKKQGEKVVITDQFRINHLLKAKYIKRSE